MGLAREAVFVNGDFESDAIGAVPSGWTAQTYLDLGITDLSANPPQTLASLNLATGGIAGTFIVGGATESQTDPDPTMGAAASLRFPKYGTRAVRLNYGPATSGASNNVNALRQTMTVGNGDVDAADNKVHIRFAIAPVLQNPGHGYTQQPYYFVRLQNITKGTNLYSDFNTSGQAGVPWKTNVGASIYYTDWQLVDIAPGNVGLAVGDQVELLVIASGCAAGGHWGRVYVDGIGSTIPGIYTSATGPGSANAGSDITYVVTYKNGGTATAMATQLAVVIPTDTTYKSTNLPSACSGVAVGATGTLTCSLGALAAGASGSFTVTVNINAGTAAGKIITNGNYTIQATGVSALLGPKVLTTVTSGVTYADIAVTKTDGVAAVGFGQAVTYVVLATNAGPGAAGTVTIADTMPAQLTGVTWTCAGSGGGTCSAASGTGNLGGTLALPVGASATYTVQANVIAGTGTGTVTNTATATLGGGVVDPDTSNNAAVDTDSIGVLRTLSVSKTNGNGGSVITVPASISCGTSCSSATGSFVNGTSVVLTASPVSGASFTAWGGACTGTSPTCTVTMNSDLSVTAAFTPPPTVNLTTGNNQGAALGTAFASPLQVRVLDSSGNPIAGATVLFSAPGSGASATLSSASVTTSATGYASITATANNTAGAYSVVAALSGTPTTGAFSLWNYGAATTIGVSGGSGQSATVGAAFASPLVIIVRDAANQLVPNVAVTYTAPASGATAVLSGATVNTGASGTASITATAGQLVGAYSVTAAATGIATPVTFGLSNTAGAASTITATSGGGQLVMVGSSFSAPLLVTVKDSFGNPVPGVVVTFAAPGSGASASLSAPSATTNASGQASVIATANATVGTYAVAGSVTGISTPVSFALGNFGPLVLSPSTITVPPLGSVTFGTTGDPTGGYTYAVATNLSGGSVNPTTGVYTAGPTGSVSDVVAVSDALVPTATANVMVGPGVSISPTPTTVPPHGSRIFSASGGSGSGFVYALTTNASGGTVDPGTGAYAAGATGGVTDAVTVTDSLGNTATATITVGAGISISPSPTGVSPRGTRTFVATGGSGTGYTFALTTNGSGGTVDPLTGAYAAGATGSVTDAVTVTDSLGNSATATIAVNAGVNLAPLAQTTPPSGIVTFAATDGSGSGYTYSVTTNLSGATIDASGKYVAGTTGSVVDVVTATDSLGNTATTTVTVGPGVTLVASASHTAPRGTITLTASGGSGTGYVFSLGTNASGATIVPGTGVYTAGATNSVTDTVVVTDSLGNVASASIVVGVGLSVSPAAPAVPPRGLVNLVASGGSGTGFAYAIVTNASGSSINASTGRFTAGGVGGSVDVVRATDSLGNTATVAISVGNGLTLNPSAPSLAPRQAQLFTAVGGSATGFAFAISTNASGGTIDAASGAYRAGATGGTTDVVTVTDSLGNTASATILVGPGLLVTPATLSVAPLATQTFAVSGGSGAGYGFVLGTNLSGGTVDPASGAYVAGGLGGVTDVLTVTDSLGNTASVSITVTSALAAGSQGTTLSAPPRGSLALTVTGGAGGNTFALTTNGSGATLDAHSGAYVAGATGSTSDLVTVTDANGATVTIRVNVSASVSLAPATPSAPPRGPLTFTASGGSGTGFQYSLNTNRSGGTIDATTGAYQAGAVSNVVDLVQVVDSLGNTASVSVSIGGGLAINPAAPQVAPQATVTFTAAGGSGTGYVFALTTNASGGSIVASTGVYHAGVTPNVGDQVTVTDSLGNSTTATISVGGGVLVAPASAKVAPGGPVTLSASGGSGAGYVFTLSTNNSGGTVDGATGFYTAGTTSSVTDTVTVTDALGNTGTASIQVGAGIHLNAPALKVPPRGALALTASGGSGNYSFSLRANGSGATVDAASGHYLAGPKPSTTDLVQVTDDLGNQDSVQIAVGPGVAITPAAPVVAPGAGVTFAASGGSGMGYVFALTTNGSGGTIDAHSGAYLAGDGNDTTDTVQATDSLGNVASVSINIGDRVVLNPPTSIAAPRATVHFVATGGSGTGYAFSLITNSSGASIDASTGIYQAGTVANVSDIVKVIDSLGKTATAEVMVGAAVGITPMTATIGPLAVITFNVAGGSGTGYRFTLAPGGSGGTIDAAMGDYQAGATGSTTDLITVTDALGNSATATITVGPALSVTPAQGTVPPRGSLALVAAGGTAPYAFTMMTNKSGGAVDPSSGAYVAGATAQVVDIVKVTDANGATAVATLSVGPAITITPASPKVAPGATVQLVAQGGAGSGFTWHLVDNSAGGSVDAASGLYTAAAHAPVAGATDVVEVKDKLGNSARVTIGSSAAVVVSASGGSSGCSCATAGPPVGAGRWTALLASLLAGALFVGTRRRAGRARRARR